MFAIGYAITLMNYDILWRYFAWANQTLAVFTLWAITVFLYLRSSSLGKGAYWLVSIIPAIFMTFICSDFVFISGQMMGLEQNLGALLAGGTTIVVTLAVCLHMRHLKNKANEILA